jgi:hypothetical protein
MNDLERRLQRLEAKTAPRLILLDAPLTSTAWDGDTYSTTAKTKIDLSTVFSAPANIRAILVNVSIKDSASAGGDYYIVLGNTDTAGLGVIISCAGLANNSYARGQLTCKCNTDGDIYYQIVASGAGTMVVFLRIWGYWI